MIELAPHHKSGLPVSSPVMIASGFCGYGNAYQPLIDLSVFGALVTQPVTLRPERGAAQPRVAETAGGFILNTGHQNSGIKKVLRQYKKIWSRLEPTIIAHLPAGNPDDLMRTARALFDSQAAIAAVELGIPADAHPQDLAYWVSAIQHGSEFPILTKMPYAASMALIEAAMNLPIDALVIGCPPRGATFLPGHNAVVSGQFYGRSLHALTLRNVKTVTGHFNVPVIAAGGIHTADQAKAFFAAGARAVQLDSILFVDPKRAESIAREIDTKLVHLKD